MESTYIYQVSSFEVLDSNGSLNKTQYYISSKQFCSTWLYVVAILVVTQSWEQHEMEKFHPRPTHYGGNLRQGNA